MTNPIIYTRKKNFRKNLHKTIVDFRCKCTQILSRTNDAPLSPSVRRRKDRQRKRRTEQHTWRQHKTGITCILLMMTLTKTEATTQLILIVSQFHPHAILIFPPHLRLHATRTQRTNQAAWSMDFDESNAKLTVFPWRYSKTAKVRAGRF